VRGGERRRGFETSPFTLRYHPDRAQAAATVISVPARVYPDGYLVDCGGCAYERVGGR